MVLAHLIMRVCATLPRGGYRIAKSLSHVIPGLRDYPAQLRSSSMRLCGDVGLNVFYPLAAQGYYADQQIEDDILTYLARDAQVIADVGGNIGYISALLATAPPQAVIKVFEPPPLCQPYLRQVAAHFSGVSVIEKAAGAEPGVAQFQLRSQVDTSSFANGPEGGEEMLLTVEVTTLDAEFAGQHVDLIKIDVEGFEDVVLQGARDTLARSKPPIMFEAYDPALLARVIDFFSQIDGDDSIYRIAVCGSWRLLAGMDRRDDETCNFVAWPGHRRPPEGLRVRKATPDRTEADGVRGN